MKAFIDRIFKNKKLKEEAQVEENKKLLTEQIEKTLHTIQDEATKASIESIVKEKIIYSKPGHYFADCNCFKCIRWRNQNA